MFGSARDCSVVVVVTEVQVVGVDDRGETSPAVDLLACLEASYPPGSCADVVGAVASVSSAAARLVGLQSMVKTATTPSTSLDQHRAVRLTADAHRATCARLQ